MVKKNPKQTLFGELDRKLATLLLDRYVNTICETNLFSHNNSSQHILPLKELGSWSNVKSVLC